MTHSAYEAAAKRYVGFCIMIATVNLTTDSFAFISSVDPIHPGFFDGSPRLSEVLRFPCEHNLLHEEDMPDYRRFTDMTYLRAYFGDDPAQKCLCIRYRNQLKSDNKWYQLEIIPQETYTSENQVCYLYIRQVAMQGSDAHILFEDALRELSENYESMYYVDFDSDVVYPYRMSNYINEQFGSVLWEKPTYDQAIRSYIMRVVMESDQPEMLRICEKAYIAAQLRTTRAFSYSFRVMHHGRELLYQVKFANVDGPGELHRAIVGFADISAEKPNDELPFDSKKKVLIVDHDREDRQRLAEVVELDFPVLQAVNGEDALHILDNRCDEIAAVMTNLDMPVCDGYELIHRMQKVKQYSSIPVIAMIGSNDTQAEIRCLNAGAAEFVIRPYVSEIIRKRLSALVRLRESTETLNLVEKDQLTGLYTREAFYQYAQRIMNENPGQDFVVVVSDVEHFKLINERYGRETANELLRYLAQTGPGNEAGFIIGGRIGEDVFACIKPDVFLSEADERRIVQEMQMNAPVPNLIIKYGYCHSCDDRKLSIQQMCDRAIIAMESIKGVYGTISARYDENLRQKWLVEQLVLDNMEKALEEQQFIIYYQPQCDLADGTTGGAEALVRWIHPKLGFISPNSFVPLFERNGFIRKLDMYIWDAVCRNQRRWLDAGYSPMPVSVNISRRDFDLPGLAEQLLEVVDSYQLPHHLIHVEVTESAYSDNPQQIALTLRKLHDQGIGIELDDFGTGYSSITALNFIDLDVLKIDMSVIRNDSQGGQTQHS